MRRLKKPWEQLASRYCDEKKPILRTFKFLLVHYNEPGRKYHNLSHIEYTLLKASLFKLNIIEKDHVKFALWFHDIIYDPKRTDNELKSAKIAESCLKSLNLKEESVERIKQLILITRDPFKIPFPDDQDHKIMIDCDLAILGETWKHYQHYRRKIELEYVEIPESIFKRERKNLLMKFLDSSNIFKTEKFQALYEERARINLKREIKFLL